MGNRVSAGLIACLFVLSGCASGDTTTTTVSPDPATTTSPTAVGTSTTEPAVTTTTEPPVGECLAGTPELIGASERYIYGLCGSGGSRPPYPLGRSAEDLEAAVAALVDGTTPMEGSQGLFTGFDAVDEPLEVEARIDDAGVAHVEFLLEGQRWNPGPLAGTSSQLFSFLDPLYATVFGFREVTALDLTTLCWGEAACEGTETRAGWQGALFVNTGVLFHRNCGLLRAWSSADCHIDEFTFDTTASVRGVADDDTLNVRSGPGTEYFVVVELAPDAVVQISAETAASDDGGTWRLIQAGDDFGWVNQAFLEIATAADEALVAALVEFAAEPSATNLAQLPLAAEVQLGLGPDLLQTVAATQLSDPLAWQFDVELFRAYVGPFSVLDHAARLGSYEVTVGPHRHCVGDPMPAPAGFEQHRRVSAQPTLGPDTSCLQWLTVDLYLADGIVEAVTIDMWEP